MAAKPTSVSASEYSEGSIRVLKGLEPVKQRPACTPAPTTPCTSFRKCWTTPPTRRWPATAKNQTVTLHTDGSVSIEDDGRGIPFGMHPEEKAPVIELVFTRLHAGGKFDKGKGGGLTASRAACTAWA